MKEELMKYNGKQDVPEGYAIAPIYIAIKGKVRDILRYYSSSSSSSSSSTSRRRCLEFVGYNNDIISLL